MTIKVESVSRGTSDGQIEALTTTIDQMRKTLRRIEKHLECILQTEDNSTIRSQATAALKAAQESLILAQQVRKAECEALVPSRSMR